MKTYVLIFAYILLAGISSAQKEANVWYFGQNAGIDFNSGSPVPFSGSSMNELEGCASIADTAGKALFYTDGLSVWNRNNIKMPNGFGLLGNNNSAQSAIIVRAPGSYAIYYIFTTPTNGSQAMRYSIVDMSLQAGLGDVTSKNVFLFNNSTEKVTAIYHANGNDIWVVGHEFNTNNFYSFLVTSAGVNAVPVITSSGTIHTSVLGFAGYMKGSHNGHKIAYACTINMNVVEAFDFDNNTGMVSNPIKFSNITEAYGLEFSPDDSKLYATEENPQLIIQWDLNAGSPAAIAASQTTVGTGAGSGFAALQLAPDGKIYLAKRTGITTLGAINNPDSAGLACNFVNNVLVLAAGTSSMYGLPNFFQGFFASSTIPPVASFQSSDTTFCSEGGKCISFFDHSTGNPTSWKWLFPGAQPDSSIQQNPTNICYNTPGTYAVTLIVSNNAGIDTIAISPMITFGSGATAPVINIVGGDTLLCSHASAYQWFFNGNPIPGATDSFYVAINDGTYNVYITDSIGCSRLGNGIVFTSVNGIGQEGRDINIFPNPTGNWFVVTGLKSEAGSAMNIYNVLGENVFDKQLQTPNLNSQTVVDISTLAKGLYFIRISNGDTVYRAKIMKE